MRRAERAVGGHRPSQPGKLQEEIGRVKDVLRQHVGQPRLGLVGQVQDQQVLDAAAGAADHHLAVRFGDLVEAGDHLLQELRVPGDRSRGERRRQEAVLESHATVGAQALDLGHRHGRVATDRLAGCQEKRLRAGDLDLLRVGTALDRVAHGLDAAAVAGAGRLDMCRIEADAPRRLQRQRQQHRAVGGLGGDRQRPRRVHRLGDRKRGAVREDAARGLDRHLAGLEQGRVQGQRTEAEGVELPGLKGAPCHRFEEAVLLLEMLGAEEQPLGPQHPVSVAHLTLLFIPVRPRLSLPVRRKFRRCPASR